jgi:muramoyltetrapeptide carboxypeptidase LdcA involved in peptidoglycan recycling
MMDVDLGHLPPAIPFLTGSLAKINGKNGKMKVTFSLK